MPKKIIWLLDFKLYAIVTVSRLATSASTGRLFPRSRRIQTFDRVGLLLETLRNFVIIEGNNEIESECFFDKIFIIIIS